MLNLRLGIYVLAIGLTASPLPVFAAAWTQESGHGEVIATTTASRADRSFDGSRNLHASPRYQKFDMQVRGEYGATDRLTLILGPGFQHIKIGTSSNSRSGTPIYAELGARYCVAEGSNWVLSGQATVHLTADADAATPVDRTGTEIDLRGLFGYSFSLAKRPAFLDVQVAHRFRSNGSPNEVHADVTFGVKPSAKWLLMAQLFSVVSEGAGRPGFPSYDYYKFQPSVVYHLNERWSAQAGAFTTYTGRHSIQENGLVFAVWYKF